MARLKFDEFCARLQEGPPSPLCVLAGEETFFQREALAALKRRLFGLAPGERPPAGAVCVLDGRSASPAEVLDEVATRGFFAEARLVLLEEADTFLRAHKVGAEFVERVARLAGPSVLVLAVKALDGRGGFGRAALRRAMVVDCLALARRAPTAELRKWVRERARHHGLSLERGAEDLLIERVGVSLAALDQELLKLSLYLAGAGGAAAGKAPTARASDIERLVRRSRPVLIYELTDAVVRGDPAGALRLARELLQQGMAPEVLLGALGAQFRRLWHIKHRVASGGTLGEACREAGVAQQFLWRRLGEAARARSAEHLAQALQLVARADTVLKGQAPVSLPRDLLVETLVLRLCRRPERATPVGG